jgi:hypothetical protein
MRRRNNFNWELICILLMFIMIYVIVICSPNGYAEVDPNQVAVGEYECELWEMWTHDTANSQKMTYMDYRAITDTTSKQYKLQQNPYCVIDERGFLMYRDNWYVVAMGSYWGKIGDKFIVRLQNGTIIPVIMGDYKADVDTDREHYAHKKDGHVLEFLIDTNSSNMQAKNVTYYGLINEIYPEFNSKIISITKMVETFK